MMKTEITKVNDEFISPQHRQSAFPALTDFEFFPRELPAGVVSQAVRLLTDRDVWVELDVLCGKQVLLDLKVLPTQTPHVVSRRVTEDCEIFKVTVYFLLKM